MHQLTAGQLTRRNVPCGATRCGVRCTVHGPGVDAADAKGPDAPVTMTATSTANDRRDQLISPPSEFKEPIPHVVIVMDTTKVPDSDRAAVLLY
jgi:hypothetical protein